MSRRPNLTPEEVERICAMRERGLSYGQIALKYGRSPGCIAWHCLKGAAEPPMRDPSWDIRAQRASPYRRGNHVVRPFTVQEDALLQAWIRAGATDSEVAHFLNRSPSSIASRLMILARRERRAEEAASTEEREHA